MWAAEALVVSVHLHKQAGGYSESWVALPGSGDEVWHCLQELHAGGCQGKLAAYSLAGCMQKEVLTDAAMSVWNLRRCMPGG